MKKYLQKLQSDLTSLFIIVKRNTLVFFKDKGTFFSALIAPLILLVLYVLFLNNVFMMSFEGAIPPDVEVPKSLIKGFVAGWELSSLLAVSCVTTAFTANLAIVRTR